MGCHTISVIVDLGGKKKQFKILLESFFHDLLGVETLRSLIDNRVSTISVVFIGEEESSVELVLLRSFSRNCFLVFSMCFLRSSSRFFFFLSYFIVRKIVMEIFSMEPMILSNMFTCV